MCNLSWTPHSSLEKDNSLNNSSVSPRMRCLKYTTKNPPSSCPCPSCFASFRDSVPRLSSLATFARCACVSTRSSDVHQRPVASPSSRRDRSWIWPETERQCGDGGNLRMSESPVVKVTLRLFASIQLTGFRLCLLVPNQTNYTKSLFTAKI